MWIKEYGSGDISGEAVSTNRADIYIEFSNGDYVRGKGFVMKESGDEMSGLTPILNRDGAWVKDGSHAVICERVKQQEI